MESKKKMVNLSSSRSSPNLCFYTVFGLVTYFIWCDLNFFGELAQGTDGYGSNVTAFTFQQMAPIRKTIKIRTQDHFAHYIYLPFCRWFDATFKISQMPGVTPNLITAIHVCVALVSARLIASFSIFLRQVGVLLYELRTLLDILDGVVYRAQQHTSDFVSGWGSYGYVIDAVADSLGGLFLMVATIYLLNKCPPLMNPERILKLKSKGDSEYGMEEKLLLSFDDPCNEDVEETYGLKRFSHKAINLVIILFTLQVFIRSALWDHFTHSYFELLERPRADIPKFRQAEVLGYHSTWFCLWIWKINSADAILHFVLLSIFFDKVWKFLRFLVLISLPNLAVIFLMCQVHLTMMRSYLGVTR